jgi:hypothetical protein
MARRKSLSMIRQHGPTPGSAGDQTSTDARDDEPHAPRSRTESATLTHARDDQGSTTQGDQPEHRQRHDTPQGDQPEQRQEDATPPPRQVERARPLEGEYRSREPSEAEVCDLIGTCFLRQSSAEYMMTRGTNAPPTASRIEAMCVPQGWRTFPFDPDTNCDEIPFVLKLREVFRRYGHARVDELWFLRVEHTLSSALDALDRARRAENAVLSCAIVADIEALHDEIAHQRAIGQR